FSNMAKVSGAELLLTRADGIWVWDEDGNRYLDGTAALWYCMVGHGRAEIAAAVRAQMESFDAYSIFGDLSNRPAELLADRLAGYAPMPDAKVFLTSGGGDAVDTAAKLARRYWHAVGQPGRVHLITRTNSYHGSHGLGTSLGGIAANHEGWGPLVADVSRVP